MSEFAFVFGREESDSEREEESGRRKKKMIHRKWSLLTGPAAILGGIVASLVVANFIFVKEDPLRKAYQKRRADRLQQALESN